MEMIDHKYTIKQLEPSAISLAVGLLKGGYSYSKCCRAVNDYFKSNGHKLSKGSTVINIIVNAAIVKVKKITNENCKRV